MSRNNKPEENRETAEEMSPEELKARIRIIAYLMKRRRERLSKEDKEHE